MGYAAQDARQEGLGQFCHVIYPSGFAQRYARQVGKAGGLQILRFQGFAVVHYNFTLSALTLKPSGFCNVEVYTTQCYQTGPIFNA